MGVQCVWECRVRLYIWSELNEKKEDNIKRFERVGNERQGREEGETVQPTADKCKSIKWRNIHGQVKVCCGCR